MNTRELIEQIQLGYDNLRHYVLSDGKKIVHQGWIHDTDFSVIERIARKNPSIFVYCNGVEISSLLHQ